MSLCLRFFTIHEPVCFHGAGCRSAANHKVRIYKEYISVCTLVVTRTLQTHLSPASMSLPPEPGGGHTSLRVRGWGSPNSDDLRKGLALCLLCAIDATL